MPSMASRLTAISFSQGSSREGLWLTTSRCIRKRNVTKIRATITSFKGCNRLLRTLRRPLILLEMCGVDSFETVLHLPVSCATRGGNLKKKERWQMCQINRGKKQDHKTQSHMNRKHVFLQSWEAEVLCHFGVWPYTSRNVTRLAIVFLHNLLSNKIVGKRATIQQSTKRQEWPGYYKNDLVIVLHFPTLFGKMIWLTGTLHKKYGKWIPNDWFKSPSSFVKHIAK